MKFSSSSFTFALIAFCNFVSAEPLQAENVCPGCLFQQPVVEVIGTAMPTEIPYKKILNGMEAYKAHQQYSPKSDLRFVIQSQNPGEVLSGLTASIKGAGLNLALDLDSNSIFQLPELKQPLTDDIVITINRRESAILLRPYVQSQYSTPTRRRLGDLRLECEIIWAIEKDDLSLLERSAMRFIGGLCGSSKSKVTFHLVKKLRGANLVMNERKLPVSIDKTGYAFSPPLHDKSWSDDAFIELEFEKQ